jgi:signal transduction histidine kinase
MREQIRDYLAGAIGRITAFLPNLLSAIAIAVVGYLLSRLAGTLVTRVLGRAGFDHFAARHFRTNTTKRTASSIAGSAVFWLGILITASLAAESLGLLALSAGINRILGFVPNVLIAAVIVGIAVPVGRLVGGFISGLASPSLGRAANVAVVVFAVFMALDQIGISRTIVTTTFTALLGAAAVAAAIAFGVGSIPLARDYAHRWARRREEQAAQAKMRAAERETEERLEPGEPPGSTRH